jgi:isocitrate lyase
MGIDIFWDCEISKTPEGYYQAQGGIEYAIARSLAVAPFVGILWMERRESNAPVDLATEIPQRTAARGLKQFASPRFRYVPRNCVQGLRRVGRPRLTCGQS